MPPKIKCPECEATVNDIVKHKKNVHQKPQCPNCLKKMSFYYLKDHLALCKLRQEFKAAKATTLKKSGNESAKGSNKGRGGNTSTFDPAKFISSTQEDITKTSLGTPNQFQLKLNAQPQATSLTNSFSVLGSDYKSMSMERERNRPGSRSGSLHGSHDNSAARNPFPHVNIDSEIDAASSQFQPEENFGTQSSSTPNKSSENEETVAEQEPSEVNSPNTTTPATTTTTTSTTPVPSTTTTTPKPPITPCRRFDFPIFIHWA